MTPAELGVPDQQDRQDQDRQECSIGPQQNERILQTGEGCHPALDTGISLILLPQAVDVIGLPVKDQHIRHAQDAIHDICMQAGAQFDQPLSSPTVQLPGQQR